MTTSAATADANVPAFAGLALDRPRIMGIVNVTPDSFSDGGEAFRVDDAVVRGLAMVAAGADILDVGGESTRPGAEPVSPDDEIARVRPVIARLTAAGALVSIDSRRADVMAAAVDAGAAIVNDVTALTGDPDSLSLVAGRGVPVILMHMQGEPRTMQDDPTYDVPSADIRDYLAERIAACAAAGIPRERIAVDPGIGFGKTLEHNLELLAHMDAFHALGCAVVLGASRKSFIGRLSNAEDPHDRTPGSIAAALAARARGVQIFRVHDVAETRQAFDVWEAIARAGREKPGS
ncbi:MAG: dihydropteroate synthase [Rhodospirillaceae bacterium]